MKVTKELFTTGDMLLTGPTVLIGPYSECMEHCPYSTRVTTVTSLTT